MAKWNAQYARRQREHEARDAAKFEREWSQKCPRCGERLDGHPSWSRKFRHVAGDRTQVCNQCGYEEAVLAAAGKDDLPWYRETGRKFVYRMPRASA